MRKRIRFYYLLLFCFMFFNTQAQLVGVFELGTGTQGNEWLRYEGGGAIGYNLFNGSFGSLCGYGGVKAQKFPIVGPADLRGSEINYIGQTTDLWNFPIFVGFRYSVNIFETKKDSERYIGIFPDCRLYFSPLIPRKIVYVEDNYPNPNKEVTLKGEKMSQWATGVGGGIFFGNRNTSYIALKFEANTIDLFESIRALGYDNDVFSPQSRQYIISISLHGVIQ